MEHKQKYVLLLLGVLIVILFAYTFKNSTQDPETTQDPEKEEEEFVSTTYTSTPTQQSVELTDVGGLNVSGVYPSLSLYPSYPDINPYNFPYYSYRPYYQNQIVPSFVADAIEQPKINYSVNPYINPYTTPYTSSYARPALTSIVNPKDFITGEWVKSGLAYTVDPNDDVVYDIYQLTLDPARELYEYKLIDKNGIERPVYSTNHLEDGDVFNVESINQPLKYQEDKYSYMYI